jgi:hypothetical protein
MFVGKPPGQQPLGMIRMGRITLNGISCKFVKM